MSVENALKRIEEKTKEQQPLFTRYDKDYKLWDNEKYIYNSHEDTINVTTNNPRTFADRLQSKIIASDRQIIVKMGEKEGVDVRKDIGKLERLFIFLLEMADKRLRHLQQPPLKDSLTWYSALRGRTAIRALIYMDGENIISDITPLDPRWLTYESGSNGLIWVNYKSFLSKDALYADYNGYEASSKINPIDDYWEIQGKDIVNYILCDKGLLEKEKPNKLLSIPFIIAPVSTRASVYTDQESLIVSEGDSIYAGVRHIYELINQVASMWATHMNILANLPIIDYIQPGAKPLQKAVWRAGRVLDVPADEHALTAMPLGDVSGTLLSFYEELSAMRQRATLSDIDYGQLDIRLSGTAIQELKEAEDKALGPILRNLDYIYTGICELIEEQILKGGYNIGIKGIDGKKYYEEEIKPVDLKRPHYIKVEHMPRTPWQQIDTLQMAQMAQMIGIPEAIIIEDLLRFQDPKRLEDLKALEIVGKDPVMVIKKALEFCIDEGREGDSKYLRELLWKIAGEQLEQPAIKGAPTAQPPIRMPPETPMGMPPGAPMGMPPETPMGMPTEGMPLEAPMGSMV